MLLANINFANTCAPHMTPLRTITHAGAHVFGGINFCNLVKKFADWPNSNPRKSFWLYGMLAMLAMLWQKFDLYGMLATLAMLWQEFDTH